MKLPPQPMATKEQVDQEFCKVQNLPVTVESLLGQAFNSL